MILPWQTLSPAVGRKSLGQTCLLAQAQTLTQTRPGLPVSELLSGIRGGRVAVRLGEPSSILAHVGSCLSLYRDSGKPVEQ